ncbi:MAG: hypothetical protein VX252_07275, partial [Myxococcota bacterium]|nr:hypothetical protein [Myxococcota bacterium]
MRRFTLFVIALFLGWPGMSTADGIDDFNQGWLGRTLIQQRLMDLETPLGDLQIIGSHNSFNSGVYSGPLSYLDPNQVDSIYNQLRMGARNVELDVHWTTKQEGPFSFPDRLLLCHGTSGHIGCSTTDRYFAEGLDEIVAWLNSAASENQVLLLHIEDHMDGQHGEAFNQINSRFGSSVYTSGGCNSVPSALTKKNILDIGKKVLIWTDGGCSGDANWNGMVFSGLGGISRIWEDSTTVGGIGGAGSAISYNDAVNAFASGVNIIDLDQLNQNDGRWGAAVWSWDFNEPNNYAGQEDCAVQHGNGRWNDDYCENQYVFACQNTLNGSWAASSRVGSWGMGALACHEVGADYQFNRPRDAWNNQALKAAKEASGQAAIWLNFDDRADEGVWTATPTLDVFFSAGSLQLLEGQAVRGLTRQLKMEPDCNLVLSSVSGGVVGGELWNSGTAGAGSQCQTVFQGDGNLVIYEGGGQAVWHSSTSGAELRLQEDGNAVIYHIGGSPLWQTSTDHPAEYNLAAGQFSLMAGQVLYSRNRRMEMGLDCDLVIQSFENGLVGGVVWRSDTAGLGTGCHADFQADGNFVLYDETGQYHWASGTSGTAGGELRLQADGNLVVYNGAGQALWGANSNIPESFILYASGFTLSAGQYVQTQHRKLEMQSDCNLVLYNVSNALVGGVLWHSDTAGAGVSCYLDFQADGNLVVYDDLDQPQWASGTSGTVGAEFWLQDDGNLVIYNGSDESLWTSNTPGSFVSESYCGDLSCGGTETCSTCEIDCGVCSGGPVAEVPLLSLRGLLWLA